MRIAGGTVLVLDLQWATCHYLIVVGRMDGLLTPLVSAMRERGYLLYRKVYRTLRGRILSGEYEPGAKIETEHELTRQLGASVITIRQAEQMLVDDGLLDKQQGRGTFVPESVTRHLKILGVCGLDLAQGFQHRMSSYFSDLLVLSQQLASERGMEFETAWLPSFDENRAMRYCDESTIMDYRGFIFFACGPTHLLLKKVREMNRSYAVISAHSRGTEPRRVWLDYPEAIRLALTQFSDRPDVPILIMGIGNLRQDVEAALKQTRCNATQCYLSGDERQLAFETGAYHRMLELIDSGQSVSRILFLDDVVAQGATRALLKSGYREADIRLVIICGRQEIIPLGFPATFIVHDTQEEVSHAFAMLDHKPTNRGKDDPSWRSGFRVISNGTT